MICVNEHHYPFPERPTPLTADPRLHDYSKPEECELVSICRHCDCDTASCCLCEEAK